MRCNHIYGITRTKKLRKRGFFLIICGYYFKTGCNQFRKSKTLRVSMSSLNHCMNFKQEWPATIHRTKLFWKKGTFCTKQPWKKIWNIFSNKQKMAYHLVRVNSNLLSYYKNIIFILSMQKKNWSTAHFDNIYASIWILFNDIWFLCCKAFYHLDV